LADGPSDVDEDKVLVSPRTVFRAAIKAATAIVTEEMDRLNATEVRSRAVRKARADANTALIRIRGRLKELGREGFTDG
jgi:hypothetical protein